MPSVQWMIAKMQSIISTRGLLTITKAINMIIIGLGLFASVLATNAKAEQIDLGSTVAPPGAFTAGISTTSLKDGVYYTINCTLENPVDKNIIGFGFNLLKPVWIVPRLIIDNVKMGNLPVKDSFSKGLHFVTFLGIKGGIHSEIDFLNYSDTQEVPIKGCMATQATSIR